MVYLTKLCPLLTDVIYVTWYVKVLSFGFELCELKFVDIMNGLS